MTNIEEILVGISSMGIAGHIRPDGDSVCSCLALYLYVKKYHPEIAVDVYLDHPRSVFQLLPGFDEIKMEEEDPEKVYDLFVTCDVAALDRLSLGAQMFPRARHTACIDHHISNQGFAQVNHVRGSLSSASEVLYTLIDPEKVDKDLAMVIYTGIIHDTGVLQYSNTSPETMRIVMKLMETGFDTSRLIDETFNSRTYVQLQIMGRVLTESILVMDGKVIVGYLRKKEMDFYGVTGQDLEGIVAQLLRVEGVMVSLFVYELDTQYFKVSLRSDGNVDVSEVCVTFGGGGHYRAAGCNLSGTVYDVINNVTDQISQQMRRKGIL